MDISEQVVEQFRDRLRDCGEEVWLAEAKGRYLALLNLFWLLAHDPPEGEENVQAPVRPSFH